MRRVGPRPAVPSLAGQKPLGEAPRWHRCKGRQTRHRYPNQPPAGTERGMRLLIADDHRIVLEGIDALLRSAGYTIIARCTDGEQVVEALEAEEPEIMVLDVQMPEPNGLDVLRLVKERRPAVKVILLTSSINNAQALEAVRLGVDGLILKEAASNDLLECIRNVSEGRQWLDPAAARLALNAAIGPAGSHAESASSLTSREIE